MMSDDNEATESISIHVAGVGEPELPPLTDIQVEEILVGSTARWRSGCWR